MHTPWVRKSKYPVPGYRLVSRLKFRSNVIRSPYEISRVSDAEVSGTGYPLVCRLIFR